MTRKKLFVSFGLGTLSIIAIISAFPTVSTYLQTRAIRNAPPIGTELEMIASAYASNPGQTDSTPCITAAGTRVRPGVVATNYLPFGTILEINGQSYIVEDRMNSRYQGRYLDIWLESTPEAIQFGRQTVSATIVAYGKPGQSLSNNGEEVIPPNVWQRTSTRWLAFTRNLSTFLSARTVYEDVDCAATT